MPVRTASNEFVFYDGPPFANGLPHYGHLLTGYAKDLVGRYQTQRGRRVERRFGWDTHGLPAELEAMKQLGMTDKTQIEAMGIDKFNDACRASVMKYADEWKSYVTRQARWVDFENDYKTLNVEYMESVLWAFKQLHEKGLTYNGYRVLPYCWKDETPLSNHELRMDDDVYKNRQDQTVTVTFPITAGESELSRQLAGVQALAWTTTPWTLPTNLALAVGPAISYVVLPAGPHGIKAAAADAPVTGSFLLAADLLGAYAKDLGYGDGAEGAAAAEAAVTSRHTGAELDGLSYEPLWDYFDDAEKYGTRTPGASSWPTTSPPPTAPASSTSPPPTVKTTRRSVKRPASPWSSRWTKAQSSCRCSATATSPRSPACRSSRPTSPSPRCSAPRAAWSARPATSTATRTAGAAATR